jgi:NADPH:quinone reductase-like Zn-dependent oxidoreductase
VTERTHTIAAVTLFAGAAIYLTRPLGHTLGRPRPELAPEGVDAVFDHLGGASVTLSYRLLNHTGSLASYSIAASRGAAPGNQLS